MEDLAKYLGLVRRSGSQNWYFKTRVPSDLVALYDGKTQIWRSLGTADRSEAERVWYGVSAAIRDEFDGKRAFLSDPKSKGVRRMSRTEHVRQARREALEAGEHRKPLTHVAANELGRTWYAERLASQSFADPDDVDEFVADLELERSILLDPDHPDTLIRVQQTADVLLERFGFGGKAGEPSYEHLIGVLRMAMLELNRQSLQRLSDGPDDAIRAALFGGPPGTGAAVAFPSINAAGASFTTIQQAADQFWNDELPDRSATDRREIKKVRGWLDLIVDFFGPSNPVSTINVEACTAYLRFLEAYPANPKKKYERLTPTQVIEAAARDGAKPMSYRTRQSYLRELTKLIRWCRARRLLTEDPLEFLPKQRRTPGDETQRVPYTIEQLQRMFTAPLYTGCKDDKWGFSRPGDQRPRRGRFWLPLLGLFTGAREGELCQLRTKDVSSTPAGTPFIQIRKEEAWMSGKTTSANRPVPIHPVLIKIGFQVFVDEQRSAGEEFLFPEMLKEGAPPSARFTRLFATFRKSLGLKMPGLDFHSFRHTAREALKRVDVLNKRGGDLDHEIDLIFGWAGGKEMRNRYAKGAWPVDELATLVEQIAYPGLDLSHVHRNGS